MKNFVDLAELFKIYVKYIFTSISLLLTNRALLEAAVSRVNVKQEFSNNYFPFQLVSQANLTLIFETLRVLLNLKEEFYNPQVLHQSEY